MSRMVTLLLAAVVATLFLGSSRASAATCSDYSNQAAAQRAKDTRDADGDGIYCESLPCPCLKPGSSSGASRPTATTPRGRPSLGRPRALGHRTRGSGCHLRGALPDPRCTPGSIYPKATRRVICVSGYTKRVRNVPEYVKNGVYAEYGITSRRTGQYEVDHLVPLEGGGSNSIANLFPQPANPKGGGPGFHEKDQLENAMHARVCGGTLSLMSAQKRIAANWVQFLRSLGL